MPLESALWGFSSLVATTKICCPVIAWMRKAMCWRKKEEKKGSFCFRRDGSESPSSENLEPQHDPVLLDKHMALDLDELLKASAFVLGKGKNGSKNGSLANAFHGNPGMVSFKPLSWNVWLKILM